MKKINDIGHRAQGNEHRAWRTGQRAKSRHEAEFRSAEILPVTIDQCLMTSNKPACPEGRQQATSNQKQATSNQKQATSNQQPVTKKPLQENLHGSKNTITSLLPGERCNSGVYPVAAAITKRRSTYSSLEATFPCEIIHTKYLTCSERNSSLFQCRHSGFSPEPRTRKIHLQNLIMEGLPM